MTKSEYKILLKDPRWKKKRLEILKRDNYTCTSCDRTRYLQVHHLVYKNAPPWKSEDKDLITLCQKCHKLWHELHTPGSITITTKVIDNLSFKEEYIKYNNTKESILEAQKDLNKYFYENGKLFLKIPKSKKKILNK